MLSPLPIDPLLPSVVEAVERQGTLVLQAAPGAGKTTRVPRALLDAGSFDGELWVLEPRRLAARLAAARVAEELGEPIGRRIGYQIRFDEVASAATRVRFVTEGILTRRLLSDPELRGVGAVVLDEFHERHLPTDLGARAAPRAPGAPARTPAAGHVGDLRPGAGGALPRRRARLTSEGRVFPVELEHLPARTTTADRAAGPRRPEAPRPTGARRHVLVFLPGAAEIRRTQEACADYAGRHGFRVLPLHGTSPPPSRTVRCAPPGAQAHPLHQRRRDLGDGRRRRRGHRLGARPRGRPLALVRPALAPGAAHQPGQRGAAGRPGRAHPRGRLPAALHAGRPRARAPSTTRPRLRAPTWPRPCSPSPPPVSPTRARFGWFEPPPAAALRAAEELLTQLGARGQDGTLTPLGRRLLSFPVHPRLGRILVEGERRGVAPEAARAAAVLSERPSRPPTFGGGRAAGSDAERPFRCPRAHGVARLRASGRGAEQRRRWNAPPVSSRAPSAASTAPRCRSGRTRCCSRSSPASPTGSRAGAGRTHPTWSSRVEAARCSTR